MAENAEPVRQVLCKACGEPLASAQVMMMLGNPEYNRWCREGFCCLACYQRYEPVAKGEVIDIDRVGQEHSLENHDGPAESTLVEKLSAPAMSDGEDDKSNAQASEVNDDRAAATTRLTSR